jgi:hypothetical protein
MLEQKHFPAYLPDNKALLQKTVMVSLTYEQILALASSLVQVAENPSNPFVRLLSPCLLSDSEKALYRKTHNALVNCALSLEMAAKHEE